MSKTLYEEAVADARKLRELAEETAKNRVVEAVMPQIRDLVNRRILGEQLDEFAEEDLAAPEDEFAPSVIVDLPQEDEVDTASEEAGSESEARHTHVSVAADGSVKVDVDSTEEEGVSDEFVLTDTMAEALGRIIRGESSESERLYAVEETVAKIKKLLKTVNENQLTVHQREKLHFSFNRCLKEVLSLRGSIILSELNTQEKLEQRLTEVIKEMKDMSKSNRQNIFDFLFEADDDHLGEADIALTLADDEVEDLVAAEDADAVDAALDDILAAAELSLGEPEEVDVDVEEEEVEVTDEEGGEAVAVEDEFAFEEGSGPVYEIDESMLRREIRRMRQLREQDAGRATEADPALAHGGEDLGDVVLDVDEDDLINALADELGDPGVPAPVVERRRRRAPRRRAPRRSNRTAMAESRRARSQVGQYRNALSGMKKQLVEMNLFNAKLLYANKLMQNKNLSVKQQRAIVEALDNAKTLREAKLLYKSLSESLSRRVRGNKLNEGALRTLGSSSRSTRSAQPASSGVEVDRWAVLAGISND